MNKPEPTTASAQDGPPRFVLILAVILGIATLGTVIVIAANQQPANSPVAIASVPAADSDSPVCQEFLKELPEKLGDYVRAPVANPAPPGAAAWRHSGGGDPVIVRCGVGRPAEFVVGSPIQMVNAVQWFRLDDPVSDVSTWIAVDRSVYVALTLPKRSGPSPIQSLSDVIARVAPAEQIRPAPPQ